MYQKALLILFGLALGGLTFWLAKPAVLSLTSRGLELSSEGVAFESVEDFKLAMLGRDERDVKADRSVSLRSIITPHISDTIMYDLLPKQNVLFQGVPVRINACGMRGREIAVEKPVETYRIAFLGDSFTFGWGVEEAKAFPSVVERVLNGFAERFERVEVLNLGVPGYSTFQQVSLFEEKGLDFRPDAVVLYFIENDFGLPFFIRNVHRSGEVISGTRFARASWKGDDQKINEQRSEIDRMLNPNRWLLRLARLGKRNGFDLFVTINPRPDWKKDYDRLPILRKSKNLRFFPLRKSFLHLVKARNIDAKDLSLPDDPHPSALKHQLLGELIAAQLLPHMRVLENEFLDGEKSSS